MFMFAGPYVKGILLCPSSMCPCTAWVGNVLWWIWRQAFLASFVLSSHTPQCFFWQLKASPSLTVEKHVLRWNKTTLLLCFKCYEKQVWCWQPWRGREREKPCDGAEWRQEIHFSVDTTSLTFLYLWFFPVFSLWAQSTGELKLGNLFLN